MAHTFDLPAIKRLNLFLKKHGVIGDRERLTPDASTREFFRIRSNDFSQIACVYPEGFDESLPQIDVTNLFLKCDLPVARIFEIDTELGLLTHEDFGDRILRDALLESDPKERENLLNSAISLIARIQKSTPQAYSMGSIASKLKFDEEKLLWELNFFKTHYFESLKGAPLLEPDDQALTDEFTELSRELESYANVLTHRDFHAANLMLGKDGKLRIIDHQDARIGSVAYDLVSLLLDRITEIPSREWLEKKMRFFLGEREKHGLEPIEFEKFDYEFDLMTVQRCLKAIGTFSNQAGNFGKTEYVQYINPMFEVVLSACRRLKNFPKLDSVIEAVLVKRG